MANYKVRMSNGEEFEMACDMVQASAGISANWTGEEDGWAAIPYQTADARHDKYRAAKLCAEYAATCDEEKDAKVVSVEEVSSDEGLR